MGGVVFAPRITMRTSGAGIMLVSGLKELFCVFLRFFKFNGSRTDGPQELLK